FDRQLESLLSARDRAPSGSRVSDDDFSPRENTLDGQERPLANADSRSVPETPLSAERIRAILAGKRVRAAAPKSSAFEKKIEKKKTEETVSMPELERESAPAKINSFPESESRFSATDLSTSSPDGGISSRGGRVENNSTLASAKILSRPANSGVYVPHLGGRGVFSPGRKVKPKTSTRSEPRPTSRAPRPGSSSEKVSSKKSRSSREEEKTFLSPKNLRPRSGRAVAPSGREITAFTAEAAGRGLPPRRVVPISRASLPETRLPKAKGGLTNTRSKLSPPEAPVLELGQVKKSSPPRLAPLSDYRPRRKTVSSIPPVGEKERIVSSDSAREGRISFFPGLARPRQKDLSRAHLSVGSGRYEQARERSFEEICRRVRENMDRQGNFLDEGKIVLEKTLSSREEAAEKSLPSRGKASDKFVEEKKSSPASGFLSRESSGEKVAVGERKGRERVEGRKSSIEKDKSPARASKLPRAVGGVHRRGEISVFAAARKNSAKSSGEKKSAEKTPSRTVSDRAISENSVLAREKTTKVSSEKSTESRFVGKKIFPVGASEKEKAHSPASEATERSFGRDDENTPALSDDLRRHLKKSAPPRSKKTAGKTLPRQAERLAKNSAQKSARSSRGRFPENFSSRSERASLVSSRKKQENSLASAPAGRERTARRDLIAQEEREPVSAPFVSSSKARKSSFSSSFSKREKSRARASFPPARETSSPREHFRDFPPPRRGTAAAAAPGGREAVVSGKFFLVLILVGALSLFGFSLAERAAAMYDDVKSAAERGFASLSLAVEKAKDKNFAASRKNFVKAQKELAAAEASLSSVNRALIDLTRFVPFLSKASSGKNAIVAARRIARAGEAATAAMESVSSVGNPLSPANAEAGNVLRLFEIFQNNLALAEEELRAAEKALAKVDPADVPLEQRAQVAKVTRLLPVALAALEKFNQNTDVLADLLGANGPRKYLFLFQNNHEIRATGGFIGSYGRLDISGGRINRFFIDGIFNPSGQMSEKIVPPKPIQKISAAWNLHDSNWFPDFPTSARKAISFYEKTGGPTVDGVIAITPEVLRKMLEV
ncbi:MAG TPA: DUF4012 domain-containing protein, partial [Candidatus Moranbacteria bacterium]|nr:DUF4012 domain-containing protein [Candidatus Moranbacteria bacterium]